MKVNTWCERFKMVKRVRAADRTKLLLKSEELQAKLSNRIESLSSTQDVESNCSTLTELINQTSEAVAGGIRKSKVQKLSKPTLDLMMKRHDMKLLRGIQHIEYREVCKTVRKYNTLVS